MQQKSSMPEPPIVARLDREIDAGSDPRLRAIALARRGAYLARTGQSADAVILAQYLRSEHRSRSDPELFCWIWILEAIACRYGVKSPSEYALLLRAHEVAKSVGLTEVRRVSAAWLAHACFDLNKYEEMVKWLNESGLRGLESPEASCRAAIVLAAALEMAGNRVDSLKWFGKARLLAQQTGDRAAVVALATNQAAMRLDAIWLDWVFGRVPADDISSISREIIGGLAFEELTQSRTMVSQVSIWKTRIFLIQELDANAFEELIERGQEDRDGLPILRSKHAIAAWVSHVCQRYSMASDYYYKGISESIDSFDVDDRATSLKLLSHVSATLIHDGRAVDLEQRAYLALRQYDSERAALANMLLEFGEK